MKIFKKALCIFLIVVMCLTSAPLQGFVGLEWPSLPEFNFGEFELPKIDFSSWFGSLAKATTITDQCGDDVYYSYNTETQELIVSGSGAIWDYEMGESPASNVAIKSVIIEEGITYIGEYAFYDCDALVTIDIREGLAEVGYGAFMNCEKLTDIIAPESIATVGEAAFYGCKSLKNLYFCGSLEQSYNISFEIFNDALFDSWIHYDYYSYEHKFTSEVTKIASCIEEGEKIYTCECGGIYVEEIKINHQNDNNDNYCDNCNIPATAIGTCGENVFWSIFENYLLIYGKGEMYNYYGSTISPFYKHNIESVVIEDGVTTIGRAAFYFCDSLTSVTIPDSVTTIGYESFYYCTSLTSITIPDGVTTIDNRAFFACTSLTSIFVDVNNSAYSSDSRGVLFDKHKTVLIQYPIGNKNIFYTIPDSVITIGINAFSGCSIINITIPDSVKNIGEYAFLACGNLKSVVIGNGVISINDYAFYDCTRLTDITIGNSVTTIGEEAFAYCESLTNIMISNSVTTIGGAAFAHCESLTNMTIPDSVTTIGGCAFQNCRNLISITIGEQVTTILDRAFLDCSSLESVKIPNNLTSIDNDAFRGCLSLKKVYIDNLNAWLKIQFFDKDSNPLSKGASLYLSGNILRELDIPESVSKLNPFAFYGYTNLISVTIPDSITSIGEYAFYNCTGLKSIAISNGVTSIGGLAFVGCTGLTSITIPDSVASIGMFAFSGCTSLKSITIPKNVTSVGEGCFVNCNNLTNINVDSQNKCYSSDSLGVLFDKNKTILIKYPNGIKNTYYSIPEVKTIGVYAFANCNNLENVIIPDCVTSIENEAFHYCDNLISITIPYSITEIKPYSFYGCNNLTDVYYNGTEEQWKEITIGSSNDCLTSATIHYNSSGAEVTTGYKREHVVDNWKALNQLYKSEYLAGFAVPMDGTNGNPDYLIPGQSENMIPQGLTYWPEKDWVLVSSYDKNEENPSAIFALDRETGAFVAQFNLKKENGKDWKPHAGGIGVSEHNLYITCDRGVAYFPLSDLDVPSGTVKDIKRADYMIVPYLYNADEPDETAYTAYVSVSDGMLWTGNFYSNSTASQILGGLLILPKNWYWEATEDSDSIIVGYELSGDNSKDEWTNLKNSNHAAKHIISVDDSIDCIQGIAFKKISDNTYNMYLSRTTDESFSASISVASVTLNKNDIYLYEEEFKHFINLPGTEGITFIGNDLYAVYESGALGNCDDLVSQVSWSQYFKDWTDVIWKVNIEKMLNTQYTDYATITYKGVTGYYQNDYFAKDSKFYNHGLASLCSILTVIGYEYDNPEIIADALNSLGMHADMNYIQTDASQFEVNNFISHRKITVNDEEYTLILVACIGSHATQWYNNFDPGTGTTHRGFTYAKNHVNLQLAKYIKEKGLHDVEKTKLLFTGHSRGSATINLLAADMIDKENIAKAENIYTYGFATPNTTSLPEARSDKYKRIFNIINSEDFVTKVVPSAWDYTKYGTIYKLPSVTNDRAAKSYIARMQPYFEKLTGGETYTPYENGTYGSDAVISLLNSKIKNLDDFYNKRARVALSLSEEFSVYEFFQTVLLPFLAKDSALKITAALGYIAHIEATGFSSGFYAKITEFFLSNGLVNKTFAHAHMAETYCAFMQSMTKDELIDDRSSTYGYVKCPVDVEIYNEENGELVGRIVNNTIDETIQQKENAVVVDVDGDMKFYALPSNGQYQVKLIGNDDGKMNYRIVDEGNETEDKTITNFFDVPVEKEKIILSNKVDYEDESKYILTFENGEILEPTEIFIDEDIETYNIEVSISEGGSASSSQTAKSGDYVSLDAIVEEGWKFAGWYENSELISTETTLAFVAKSDRSLEAKFEHVDHSLCEWYEVTPATCEEKGSEQRDCSECDYSETQEIPAVEHNYEAVITPATCYSNGFTTNTCTKCGNGYTSDITAMLTHNLSDWYTVTDATCEANGVEQRDCSECDYSETQEIPATGHDFDGSECKNCDYDKADDCGCNCHKGGIAGFFFKIILFFQKIFKTNQICEGCGIKHY